MEISTYLMHNVRALPFASDVNLLHKHPSANEEIEYPWLSNVILIRGTLEYLAWEIFYPIMWSADRALHDF